MCKPDMCVCTRMCCCLHISLMFWEVKYTVFMLRDNTESRLHLLRTGLWASSLVYSNECEWDRRYLNTLLLSISQLHNLQWWCHRNHASLCKGQNNTILYCHQPKNINTVYNVILCGAHPLNTQCSIPV